MYPWWQGSSLLQRCPYRNMSCMFGRQCCCPFEGSDNRSWPAVKCTRGCMLNSYKKCTLWVYLYTNTVDPLPSTLHLLQSTKHNRIHTNKSTPFRRPSCQAREEKRKFPPTAHSLRCRRQRSCTRGVAQRTLGGERKWRPRVHRYRARRLRLSHQDTQTNICSLCVYWYSGEKYIHACIQKLTGVPVHERVRMKTHNLDAHNVHLGKHSSLPVMVRALWSSFSFLFLFFFFEKEREQNDNERREREMLLRLRFCRTNAVDSRRQGD